LFIGSSSEGLKYAEGLQDNLQKDADVTIWTQDVFQVGDFTLESLLNQLGRSDLGVFVLTLDDVLRIRKKRRMVARDNVIFEFGIFVGGLGRKRSIVVAQEGKDAHLPTDFMGLNILRFDGDRSDDNWVAAMGPASNAIKRRLASVLEDKATVPDDLGMSFPQRRDNLSESQRRLLRVIEERTKCSREDIKHEFSEMPEAELHYRLEHLRLLMFIVAWDDDTYSLTDPYARTRG
jgi:hypothetical protein